MIDISDGLSIDLSRLLKASGVAARLELDRLPVGHLATIDDALGGGEDYELLAALPDPDAVDAAAAELKEAFGVPLSQIGIVVEGEGPVAVSSDGSEHPLEPTGWDHFR